LKGLNRMSSSLSINVRAAMANTVQAIRFAESALVLFQEISPHPLSPNLIKELFYQDSVEGLTEAYLAIKSLPFDTQYPSDPIFPNTPIVPGGQENPMLIKLSDNRSALAQDRTNDAIKSIGEALQQCQNNETLSGQLVFIKMILEAARASLIAGFNSPDFIVD
jgi:hypothetical protein